MSEAKKPALIRVWRVRRIEGSEVKAEGSTKCIELGESAELPEQLAEYLVARGDYSKSAPVACLSCKATVGIEAERCWFCGLDPKTQPAAPGATAGEEV